MSPTPAAEPIPSRDAVSGRASLLLVDDQPEGLLALEAMLEGLGQNLVKARSGAEALRALAGEDFALVLLDVRMPIMDGLETARRIRELERSRDTPLIFVTAANDNDTRVIQGYALGAVDYIVKPVIPEILRSKVSVFVELARKTELVRRQAREMQRLNESLRSQVARLERAEREIRTLNARLERRAEELLAVNQELEAFSYSVSHDLQEPLRGIDGFTQALVEDWAGTLGAEGQDQLRRVRAAAQRMGQLIDDLLQLSRVTRAELTPVPVDLSALAREVAEELRERDPGRSVEFRIPDGMAARGDPRLLRQVLQNLLGNAWKFTSRRPEAVIEVSATPGDGGATYAVRDNGVGFDRNFVGKLFRPFQRLHLRRDFAGSGVGLATVQRIVRRHGGRVWAEGEVGRGAAFHFTLPSAPPEGAP
ncbi:MAG: response regulator [Planctomycetales bacterium]|nr:response regulator [Planctomycetales bacterium]